MDKNTLSQYGWIVVVVVIIAILIGLATPFAGFIRDSFVGNVNSLTNAIPDLDGGAGGSGGGGSGGSETPNGYTYGDIVEQGQYRYTYVNCESYEEFELGEMKIYAYLISGETVSTREEGLEVLASLFGYGSWAEAVADGWTEESFLESWWICEEAYNERSFLPGWKVQVKDTSLTQYDAIPEQVDGIPVVSMESTFASCESLITAPHIPQSVINMYGTFQGCTALTTAPVIPSGVTSMIVTFNGCTNLTGTIEINANPTSYNNCFLSTTKPITITGSCSDATKAALAGTANKGNVTY